MKDAQYEFEFSQWKEWQLRNNPMRLETDSDDIEMMFAHDRKLKYLSQHKPNETMSKQMMTGSLCLSDIPKDKVFVSEKSGKKYLNIVLWVNDEPDKYGNHAAVQVGLTKEEREAKVKPVYIGNLKIQGGKPTEGKEDDLPF